MVSVKIDLGSNSTEYKMLWYKAWMVEKKAQKPRKNCKILVSNACMYHHLLDQREERNIKWNTLEISCWIFRYNFDI